MGQVEQWVIGMLIALASVLLALFTYQYSRRKDRDGQIREQAATGAKLDVLMNKLESMDKSVTTSLGGMESRFQGLMDKLDSHAERIAKVEESAKQAHKRIDELKGGHEG